MDVRGGVKEKGDVRGGVKEKGDEKEEEWVTKKRGKVGKKE